MRLIGLAVVLTVSIILAPLAGEAQQVGKMSRIGVLRPAPFHELEDALTWIMLIGLTPNATMDSVARWAAEPVNKNETVGSRD